MKSRRLGLVGFLSWAGGLAAILGFALLEPRASGQTGSSPSPSASAGESHRVLDPSNRDSTCKACDDFNTYANGGWLKKNPVPPEYSRWGTFSELTERNREALRRDPGEAVDPDERARLGRAEARRLLRELHGRSGGRGRRGQSRSTPSSTASRRSEISPISRPRSRACNAAASTRSSASVRSRTARTRAK